MLIYLIRHTKVDCPPGICYGSTDLDVTTSFPREKEKIQAKIRDIAFNQVYSSPLQRCQKLAQALFSEQKIITDDRLQEMDFGLWEQQSWDSIYHTSEGKYWMDHYLDTPCPNGESYADLQHRVTAFYDEIRKYEGKNIAIVTHNGVIRVMKSLFLQMPAPEIFGEPGLDYGGVAMLHDDWKEL